MKDDESLFLVFDQGLNCIKLTIVELGKIEPFFKYLNVLLLGFRDSKRGRDRLVIEPSTKGWDLVFLIWNLETGLSKSSAWKRKLIKVLVKYECLVILFPISSLLSSKVSSC